MIYAENYEVLKLSLSQILPDKISEDLDNIIKVHEIKTMFPARFGISQFMPYIDDEKFGNSVDLLFDCWDFFRVRFSRLVHLSKESNWVVVDNVIGIVWRFQSGQTCYFCGKKTDCYVPTIWPNNRPEISICNDHIIWED